MTASTVAKWLEDTLSIPLTASNQSLGTIKSHQRPFEMEPEYGLVSLVLNGLIKPKTHLPNNPDKHIERLQLMLRIFIAICGRN